MRLHYFRKSLWILLLQLIVAIASFSQVRGSSGLDLFPGSYGWFADSETVNLSGDGSGKSTPPAKAKFQMAPAVRQALFFTGIMHAGRYGTQEETRSATYGPFVPRYFDSVRELRGWDDSDSFTTSYILHPMEGSVFAYIQQQNDPRYRTAEWGSGRDYWISRLRAMAFSAALSTQWTMGPFSEASLGNVQLHDSPGFVDIVGTPTMGVAWMIGEDLLDRYAVIAVENRTANPVLLLLARSCFTPTRAFANMMALKVPWHRVTRPGFFGTNRARRSRLIKDYESGMTGAPFGPYVRPRADAPSTYPLAADIELTTSAYYESFLGGGSCVGGGGSGAVRVSKKWQIVAEGSGCLVLHMPQKNQSGDSEMFVAGVRWTPLATHRVSPHVQVLAGGRRISHEIDDVARREKLDNDWRSGRLSQRPLRTAWSVTDQSTGPAVAVGAGIDLVVTRSLAWRLANVQYTRAWVSPADQVVANQGIKVTSEVVLRIGTW